MQISKIKNKKIKIFIILLGSNHKRSIPNCLLKSIKLTENRLNNHYFSKQRTEEMC